MGSAVSDPGRGGGGLRGMKGVAPWRGLLLACHCCRLTGKATSIFTWV